MRESETTKKALEQTSKELTALKLGQEEAAKRQRLDIEEMKQQMAQNNENTRRSFSGFVWEYLTKLNERKEAAGAIMIIMFLLSP
jgi:hypothetical protein